MDDETRRGIEAFRRWVDETKPGRMVFFGGAGVSTESGIPDFRSPDGLYAQKYPHPPEQMISRSFFDGSVLRNFCMDCGAAYPVDELLRLRDEAADGVPRCPACGGIVKPDVVLYEEALDERTLQASVDAIARADLLVVAGTSLAVYPAAGLIDFFQGDPLVIVNRTPSPRDRQADLCLAANVGDVFDF